MPSPFMKKLFLAWTIMFLVAVGCVHKQAAPPAAPMAGSKANSSPAPSANTAPPAISWADCIKTKGSVIEQTYPEVCVTPDGRKAAHPSQ